MLLSCTSDMVPGSSITEKAELLHKWGYSGMAVFANYDKWDDKKQEELLTLREKTGVIPCEFVFQSEDYGHLMSDNQLQADATRKMYKHAARISGMLNAVTELEFVYGAQSPLPLFDIYNQMTSQQEMNFIAVYKNIASELVGTGGYVLIEGINRYESPYMNSIIDCKRIADKTGLKETGVLADFFHMSIEEDNIEKSINAMEGSIKHVHLGDNNRKMPGMGSINWETGLRALKNQEYNGFLNLECSCMGYPQNAIPQAAEFLNRLLLRI